MLSFISVLQIISWFVGKFVGAFNSHRNSFVIMLNCSSMRYNALLCIEEMLEKSFYGIHGQKTQPMVQRSWWWQMTGDMVQHLSLPCTAWSSEYYFLDVFKAWVLTSLTWLHLWCLEQYPHRSVMPTVHLTTYIADCLTFDFRILILCHKGIQCPVCCVS